MNSPFPVAAIGGVSSGPSLLIAVRRAVDRLSPRTFGTTLLVALGFQAWLLVEIRNVYPTMNAAQTYLSGTIINVCMSLCIMFATLVADEWVDLGARRLPTYIGAVVAGAALGAVAQWLVHRWLGVMPVNQDVPSANPLYDVSGRLHVAAVEVTQPAVMFFEFLIWGSIIVFIYVELRAARRATQRMTAAYVARARAQRHTLESRLIALQARVEPQFLFNTLARVRDLYDEDVAQGARTLDDLIAYLRAALPHLRGPGSTLAREIELAAAYLRIVHARDGAAALAVDATDDALVASVPAMVLLPLIDRVMAVQGPPEARSRASRIVARVSGHRLRIVVSFANCGLPAARLDADALALVRERLRGLYGDDARIDCDPTEAAAAISMEIPYETADGGYR